jgi:hypothetical protein
MVGLAARSGVGAAGSLSLVTCAWLLLRLRDLVFGPAGAL